MDHHCMWTDNCVAANNFKYYFRVMALVSLQFSVCFVVFIYSIATKDIQPKGVSGIKSFVPFAPLWFDDINVGWYLFDAFIFANSIFYALYPVGTAL